MIRAKTELKEIEQELIKRIDAEKNEKEKDILKLKLAHVRQKIKIEQDNLVGDCKQKTKNEKIETQQEWKKVEEKTLEGEKNMVEVKELLTKLNKANAEAIKTYREHLDIVKQTVEVKKTIRNDIKTAKELKKKETLEPADIETLNKIAERLVVE